MDWSEAILLICVLLVMLAGLFILFGGMQVVVYMHATRQYRKVLAAWYQRTNPDDPMPIFDPETHSPKLGGDGDE